MTAQPDDLTSKKSFHFGESTAPPLLPFLNRGKKPTIYYVAAAGLLILFPLYMFMMFEFLPTPFVIVTGASLLLLIIVTRHYLSLVTEARVDAEGLHLRGLKRFRTVRWEDLDAVTVSRQMDPDYLTFRLVPLPGRRLAVRKFRIWNKNAALSGGDPVQAMIDAIRVHLVRRAPSDGVNHAE